MVVHQPRTEVSIATSGLQDREKVSFCRLNPSPALCPGSPGTTVGLSGQPAITCHLRKSKAQERLGHTPGESGETPGGSMLLHPPGCFWQRGVSTVPGGALETPASPQTLSPGPDPPLRGSRYPVEAAGRIQSLVSSAPSLPGENSGRGSRRERQEMEKHRPQDQPPSGCGRRWNIWPTAFT